MSNAFKLTTPWVLHVFSFFVVRKFLFFSKIFKLLINQCVLYVSELGTLIQLLPSFPLFLVVSLCKKCNYNANIIIIIIIISCTRQQSCVAVRMCASGRFPTPLPPKTCWHNDNFRIISSPSTQDRSRDLHLVLPLLYIITHSQGGQVCS